MANEAKPTTGWAVTIYSDAAASDHDARWPVVAFKTVEARDAFAARVAYVEDLWELARNAPLDGSEIDKLAYVTALLSFAPITKGQTDGE